MNHLLRGFAVLGFVLSTPAPPAAAQWGIAVDVHRTGFGGTSYDTSAGGTQASFRPGNTPAVTLRVDRRLGRAGVALGVRYSRSAIVLDAADFFAGFHDEAAAIEAAPEVRIRLVRTHPGATIHVFAGPVIGVWMLRDQGTRSVVGALAGLMGEFPVLDRLVLEARVGGGLTGSLFRAGELPPVFERRPTTRFEIGLGLRYGRR